MSGENQPGDSDWARAWFRVAPRADCAVVSAGGEVDLDNVTGFKQAVQVAVQSSPYLLLDLTDVTFIDSTGLGVLIWARNRARDTGGSVVLVHPPAMLQKVLRLTRLAEGFTVVDTLDQGLDAIGAS